MAPGHSPGAPHLVSCSAVSVLKFLIIFEQGALQFPFALGSANYVAGPAFPENWQRWPLAFVHSRARQAALRRARASLGPCSSPHAPVWGLVVWCTLSQLSFAPSLPIPWSPPFTPTLPAWQPSSELCPCPAPGVPGTMPGKKGILPPSEASLPPHSLPPSVCSGENGSCLCRVESQGLYKSRKIVE